MRRLSAPPWTRCAICSTPISKLQDAAPTASADGGAPGLPALLQSTYDRIQRQSAWLHANPTKPSDLRGGWFDANADGMMGRGDQLLIDFFVPGTQQRVFDFSTATPIDHETLPLGSLVSTAELPQGKCAYKKWHLDTLPLSGIGGSDGISFSPDGTRVAFPASGNDGKPPQVHVARLDGSEDTCLTCAHTPLGWNDGARFRPNHPDTILFVSTRDHPHSIGGDGGGIGQELYAMRADGSEATRLTTSDGFATNYHANFSHDGNHVVWGTTDHRTWQVVVADFVDDDQGMRLTNQRRLRNDTTWWETHDFTNDNRRVITTNTRAGLESSDIYAVDIDSGELTRLTDAPPWDEHAHLSPDGRVMTWISGRWHPAAISRFADGSLDATFDFFWIVPGIFFDFSNRPVGFSSELTLMNNDGTEITQLTDDGLVCADNQWSADGTRILFRQSPPDLGSRRASACSRSTTASERELDRARRTQASTPASRAGKSRASRALGGELSGEARHIAQQLRVDGDGFGNQEQVAADRSIRQPSVRAACTRSDRVHSGSRHQPANTTQALRSQLEASTACAESAEQRRESGGGFCFIARPAGPS